MKKNKHFIIMVCLCLTFASSLNKLNATAHTHLVSTDSTKTDVAKNLDSLHLRVNQIKSIDKSKLNAYERKALRKELRTIKKNAIKSGGGVYISIGALLVVILLLILLL